MTESAIFMKVLSIRRFLKIFQNFSAQRNRNRNDRKRYIYDGAQYNSHFNKISPQVEMTKAQFVTVQSIAVGCF
jgi:hypothetical protein